MGVNRLLAGVIYLTYKCCNSADRYTNDIFNCTLKRHCSFQEEIRSQTFDI